MKTILRVPGRLLLVTILIGAGPARAEVTALVGGTVHPVSGPVVENGTVLFENGKLTAVGAGLPVPEGARRVDAQGLHLYPGMIDANTSLGLVEIESVDGPRDLAESGDLNPNARAKVAIHADSELIPVTRANGILIAHTGMRGSLMSGLSVIWYLDGWNWEDFTIQDPAGLHIEWPSMVASHSDWGEPKSEEDQKKEREKALKQLRDAFDDARAYRKARVAMAAGGPHHETDVRWEAMIPVLDREIPVFIHADEYQQIEGALDFAREQKLRIVLVGGRDAWRLADRLAAEDIPVIVDTIFELPRRSWEAYDEVYRLPARLHEAGVPFCISNGTSYYSTAILRNLPYAAAMTAAFGLPREEALKSVTLYPAQILGIADRVGSLEVGRDATLIVTDGDPLEVRTRVLMAWIQGEPVDLASRHTRLYDRYQNRPRTDGAKSRLRPGH